MSRHDKPMDGLARRMPNESSRDPGIGTSPTRHFLSAARLKSGLGALRPLTNEESLVGLVFLALAVVACLMPTHNDTWWHLRSGQEMIRTRALLFEDRFSFTAYGGFFWNHSWLSQLVFYP